MSFADLEDLFPEAPLAQSLVGSQGKAARESVTRQTASDYSKTSFMVIDDQEPARRSLRLSVQGMGGFLVSFCSSHSDALRRIRDGTTPPEIILCDFDLGPGRDGQQLLEELRRKKLIPQSTIFIMVTAERYYEKVVSVVELAPDDYILKPFTPNQLHRRIDRLVLRKKFFFDFFRLQDAGDHDGALAELDILQQQNDAAPYKFDILRKRSETLLFANRYEDAIGIYSQIIEINPFFWAKAGLAKAFYERGEMVPARELIEDVVEEAPKYFSAFDLKATICTDMGDHAEAQRALEQVCFQNPRNYTRKASLAEAAAYNGDYATARKTIADVVANHADISLAEILQLARIAAVTGDQDLSGSILESIPENERQSMSEHDEISLASTEALLGNDVEFLRMRRSILAKQVMPSSLGLDIVSAAMVCQDLELALTVAKRLMSNESTKKSFRALYAIFHRYGHDPEFKRAQNESAHALILARQTKR